MDGCPCSVEDCESRAICRGWCGKHYARWLKHGDLEERPRKKPVVAVGERYGHLVVLAEEPASSRGRRYRTRCDCGEGSVALGARLRSGLTKTCGCRNGLPAADHARGRIEAIYRRNASERGVRFALTVESFNALLTLPCHYCGAEPSTLMDVGRGVVFRYNGIDRVVNDRGYEPGNVVTCCERCNRMKSALSVGDFLAHAERIASFQRQTV